MSESSESPNPSLTFYAGESMTIRQPKLVSLAYTAVYDTGAVQVGAVVADDSGEPLTVEFKNARGQATPL